MTRFTQEAGAAAGLSHPNIVAVFDSGSEAVMHDLVRSRGSTIRGGRTNIEVSLGYNPPGDKAGELVKDPDQQVQRGRRFPQGCGAWRPRRRLTCLPDVRPRLMSGRTPLRIRHQSGQVADEVHGGRREHSILWSC